MILETIKAEGLAHLSYFLADDGRGVAVVIDPRRDVDIYLELARRHNVRLTHILETHIHADFVSGSVELQSRTGAPIRVGAAGEYGFPHQALNDGDVLAIGGLTLRVLHTPGHTPEHVCFLVSGGKASQEPWGLFSGDTLFAGEVGRPDLLGQGTEDPLARSLYRSLHKVLTLGDGIEVYPAHGQGSPCGGSIGDRNTTTIGYERRFNRNLPPMSEIQFIENVLSNLPPAPTYYGRTKKVNAAGPAILNGLPHIPAMDANLFAQEMKLPQTTVLDTREIEAFGGAHIPGALNICLRDEFPQWAGWMLEPEARLLLVVSDEGRLDEVTRHLIRVGYENIRGFLRLGMRNWYESGLPFERVYQMSVHELREKLTAGPQSIQLLDVRRNDEWVGGFIPTATHCFAPCLPDYLDQIDRTKPIVVYCGSGYRASVAASLLRQSGISNVSVLAGSMAAWRSAGYPTEIPTQREGTGHGKPARHEPKPG